MSQNYSYPSASTVTITGIGSPNNAAIPPESVLVAGENPSGDQKVIQTDATGNLLIAATQLPASLGQKVMASSVAVAIASDQSTLPVSAASLPLPAGAATSANQTALSAQIPATLGAKATAASLAVNIASDQTVPVSAAALPLPAGASTSANQTTGNTSLSSIATSTGSIDTKTPALGQALSAASVPVVLPAAQITTLTPPTTINAKPATPTALTVTQAAVTVGTTAVRLTVAGTAPAATRVLLVVTPDPTSTASFYIGSSSVANSGASRGVFLSPGQVFIANSDAGDYYIISSVASQTVTIMEQA